MADESYFRKNPVSGFLDLVAAGFCVVSADAFMKNDYERAIIALSVGLIVFLIGIYWPRLERILAPSISEGALQVASDFRWWLAVIGLIFFYVAAPPIIDAVNRFRHAMPSQVVTPSQPAKKPEQIDTPAAIPTSLRLAFSSIDANPQKISSTNVKDWKWSYYQEACNVAGSLLFSLTPSPSRACPLRTLGTGIQFSYLWILVVSFEHLTTFRDIQVSFSSGTAPETEWETKYMDGKMVVLVLHGNLSGVQMKIDIAD